MWELFWIAFSFAIGMTMGQTRATNADITERTSYMQNLIDKAYVERDTTKQELDFANLKLDMWQERYWNLLEELEKEEDGPGSGIDGSSERSQGSDQLQEN